jgi:hypothetical protein
MENEMDKNIYYIKILGGLVCGAYLLYSGVHIIYREIDKGGNIPLKFFQLEFSASTLGMLVIIVALSLVYYTIRCRLAMKDLDKEP